MTAVSQAQLAEAEPGPLRRTRRLLMAVALLGVAVTAVREVMDPDLWWHMATGRYILAQGRIPAYDVFSFTAADHRWVTHEWLSDLLLYVGSRLVGLAGLAVLFTLVIVAAYALVWMRCRGRPVLAAFAVVLAALAPALPLACGRRCSRCCSRACTFTYSAAPMPPARRCGGSHR